MKFSLSFGAAIVLTLANATVLASETSPYAGEEERSIKALSESQIAGFLAGEGMGYARAAELNGYPGPAHVLDLAEQLDLTEEQIEATQALFDQVKADARELGAQMVAAEEKLDQAFGEGTIDDSSMAEMVSEIAEIDGQLRLVHLEAHLKQVDVLTDEQVKHYMELRGYKGDGGGMHHH